MSQKKLKKLESCDPRVAAEVDKVFKEIDGPAIPEDCKYPELWYKCTEDLRERNEEVTLAKVKSSYNKLLKEITEKKASFIGNTIIPELDHLMHVKRIDINDKRRTIEEFKRAGLGSVGRYLEMVSPGEYKALVDLVKTSKKALVATLGKKWDDMGFSQREKILTAVGYGNMAYQLAANSWNTLPQYVIDSIKQRLAKRKKAQGGYETCPRCKGTMVVRVPGSDEYKCPQCNLQFKKSKTAGEIIQSVESQEKAEDILKRKGIKWDNTKSVAAFGRASIIFFATNMPVATWIQKSKRLVISKKADADYDKYFNEKMKEKGITSPAELSVEEKKNFFDEVDKGWKAKNEKSGKFKKADVAYDKYFEDKMKERGITSPSELSVEEKKNFFDEVDKGWKAKKETD